MTHPSRLSSLLVTALIASACRTTSGNGAAWSYDGSTGPAHWAELDPAYALAESGREQSPVNIVPSAVVPGSEDALEIAYAPAKLDVMNNGHTVEDDYHDGGHIVVGGQRYELAQFHFHSPSEHAIDAHHAQMEMHLVHRDASGNLAVLAVMIERGANHPALAAITDHLPVDPGRASHVDGVTVDAAEFLPESSATYRYSGSLTTPPCTEGVRWFLFQEPIEASNEQIDAFQKVYFGNNRPTQPLYDRVVVGAE